MLAEFREIRDRCWPSPRVPAFLLSMRGTRVHPGHFRETFHRLCEDVGVGPAASGRRPRVHDLRHTFAVRTLVEWYRNEDVDVVARLPRLSSYLGHAAPMNTYWYLQATPELLAAAGRLDRTEGRS